MKRKRKISRSRSPDQLAALFGRRLEIAIRGHTHLPGIRDCFAVIVCGMGKSASHRLINPWKWRTDDLVAHIDRQLLSPETWGEGDYPHSNNIHELAVEFMHWVDTQAGYYPNARRVACVINHPDGAATLSFTHPTMKAQLITTVEAMAAEQFK